MFGKQQHGDSFLTSHPKWDYGHHREKTVDHFLPHLCAPMAGKCPGGQILHGSKPLLSSKTPNSKVFCGWLWIRFSFRVIWSPGQTQHFLFFLDTEQNSFPLPRKEPHVAGKASVFLLLFYSWGAYYALKEWWKGRGTPKWDSWGLSHFSTYNNPQTILISFPTFQFISFISFR
jgi:hypothetical protein